MSKRVLRHTPTARAQKPARAKPAAPSRVTRAAPVTRVNSARQDAILAAALRCFGTRGRGYERTTMADVRREAGASTGSIYHHFKSKEQLAAVLFLEGVRLAQEQGLVRLLRESSAERGIRAVVGSYLDWVEENPEWARFLLSMRDATFIHLAEQGLASLNRGMARDAATWFEQHAAQRTLRAIDPSLLSAILFGPASQFARQWLNRTTRVSMRAAKAELGRAAFHALKAAGQADGAEA